MIDPNICLSGIPSCKYTAQAQATNPTPIPIAPRPRPPRNPNSKHEFQRERALLSRITLYGHQDKAEPQGAVSQEVASATGRPDPSRKTGGGSPLLEHDRA